MTKNISANAGNRHCDSCSDNNCKTIDKYLLLLDCQVFPSTPIVKTEHSNGCQHNTLSRSEEHTSELQSLMRISYAVFCLKKNTQIRTKQTKSNTKSTPHNYN